MKRNLKKNAVNFIVAIAIGASSSLFIYLSFLQRNFFSKTYVGLAILVFIIIAFFIYISLPLIYKKAHAVFEYRVIGLVIAVSLALSIILLGNWKIQPFYALLPQTNLKLTIQSSNPAGQNGSIEFISLRNSLGYIPFSKLRMEGSWQDDGKAINISPDSLFSLEWKGHAGALVEILFKPTDFELKVDILINGVQDEVDLFRTSKEFEVSISRELPVPFVYKIPFIISFLIMATFLFFMIFLGQTLINIQPSGEKHGKTMWYFSGLPLVVACLFALLIFWPGIMTPDSKSQWLQALSGSYTDWHPLFHTLLIALLMRLWYSPAVVALVQITALALTFMLGIRALEKHGVPKGILWTLSLVFALWPPTPLMAITLWKDIFYAIAIFGFFILLLEISLSEGEWLTKPRNWLWLGAMAFFTAVFRQNGIAVSLITMTLLPVFFNKNRKSLAYAFMVFITLWVLIKFPIANYLEKDNSASGNQLNIILLPHLAAHIDQGTSLKVEENQYLSSLLPLDQWKYQCCYIGSISYADSFKRTIYLQNFGTNFMLAVNLFLRDPLVDIRHQFCAGEMVWKFLDNSCSQKSAHGFNSISAGNISWISPNDYGIREASKIPSLITPYMNYLGKFGFFSDQLFLLLRPALYSIISILLIISTSIRLRSKYLLTSLLLVLSQVLTLFAINFAPSFRYQFGTCLIGIFCIGIYFLPNKKI